MPEEIVLHRQWWDVMSTLCMVQVACGCGLEPNDPNECCDHCRPQMVKMRALDRKLLDLAEEKAARG